jgi:hypothetical protein
MIINETELPSLKGNIAIYDAHQGAKINVEPDKKPQ